MSTSFVVSIKSTSFVSKVFLVLLWAVVDVVLIGPLVSLAAELFLSIVFVDFRSDFGVGRFSAAPPSVFCDFLEFSTRWELERPVDDGFLLTIWELESSTKDSGGTSKEMTGDEIFVVSVVVRGFVVENNVVVDVTTTFAVLDVVWDSSSPKVFEGTAIFSVSKISLITP